MTFTTRGPGPPEFNFCQLIYVWNPGKIKDFCPKSYYLRRSSNLFMNVMQQTSPDLPHGTVPGAQLLEGKTFFSGLHLYLARRFCENLQVPGTSRIVNPTRSITWFVSVTIYCAIFNNNSPPPLGLARGVQRARPIPNWNNTNDKNVTKKPIVSSVSVALSIFAYNSTRVKNQSTTIWRL